MKKALPYILGTLLISAIVIYLSTIRVPKIKKISTYISLDKKDKNPYGAYVFHESLKRFFPKSDFKVSYKNPGDNKVFGDNKAGQLYVILRAQFYPTKSDMNDIITFIDRGNNVFISSFNLSPQLAKHINARASTENYINYPYGEDGSDTMQAMLSKAFAGEKHFVYPGTAIEGFYKKTDSAISTQLGYNGYGQANLVHLKKGEGNLYIHLSPLAFSNYFLLYKNNIRYFEQIFSQFPASTPSVIWDEYFSSSGNKSSRNSDNWFGSIMKNPYFSAGVLTALLLLLIYGLTEMRRRQRVIPIIEKPVNDSLEFVKTMGLLYYERGDHINLAQKMSTYFLEHIRSRYKIFSKNLNKDFIKELSYKSGVNEFLVKDIITQINQMNNEGVFSDIELIAFQNKIESFYNQE